MVRSHSTILRSRESRGSSLDRQSKIIRESSLEDPFLVNNSLDRGNFSDRGKCINYENVDNLKKLDSSTDHRSSYRGHSIERSSQIDKSKVTERIRNSIDRQVIQEKGGIARQSKNDSSLLSSVSRGVKASVVNSGVQTAKSTKTLGKYKITLALKFKI